MHRLDLLAAALLTSLARPPRLMLLAAACAMLVAPAAEAHRLHTVRPGDTLWWIAAQNDLTTRAVAVYNGLAPDANVVLGGTIEIPTEAEAAAALAAGAHCLASRLLTILIGSF